ncbi:transporter [Escherichia coli]|nr:transporter [Escherichia coli]PSZ12052.1 transporter [Escherichia coli]
MFLSFHSGHYFPLFLFPAALIPVSFVVLLPVPFPGVPLAGRAVVNGASGAVSALAGFHP